MGRYATSVSSPQTSGQRAAGQGQESLQGSLVKLGRVFGGV
jgi:hypothetical protein